MSESDIIRTITVYLLPVLFAISLRESARGYVARYFGDHTAEEQGRLTFNPLPHIDIFGTLVLPLLLALLHLPLFGFSKPTPVDYSRLRNPKKHMAMVAAAGPAASFVIGLAWMLALVLLHAMQADDFFIQMAKAGVSVNSVLLVFNLIPIPPLDGGRIMIGILPMHLARPYASIERYSTFVMIGLILLMQGGLMQGLLAAGMQFFQTIFYVLATPLIYLLS